MKMKSSVILISVALVGIFFSVTTINAAEKTEFRRISKQVYIDKMKAGWIGQMAGVGWGAPTEFRHQGTIIPIDEIPEWKPEMINQFHQDDIYVEMTFLRSLEVHGLDVSIRQAGIDFANSGYPLWHANRAGRDNLRKGIAPPDSGHPKFNSHADDIDYQIEADYSGLIAPGLPNTVIDLGNKFGRLMNYGDGLYGGQFVGAMYATAFFEDDIETIIHAGLECIPKGSQYYECISDTIKWYHEYPEDWKKTWNLINEKYHKNPDYRRASCSGPEGDFNIDAKINGAYIVMGLLYGEGDPDKTIIISTRCGQDSDCNPSNAAGILFTTIGFSNVPDKFKSALDPTGKFSHTPYNFPTLVGVCNTLTRSAVVRAGGKIVRTNGGEELVIPAQTPRPNKLQQCWEPGPIANSRFTEEEMKRIMAGKDLSDAINEFAPGWKIKSCGSEMNPGLYDELRGKENVLLTHPLSRETGCTISRKFDVPKDKKTKLHLLISHDTRGDWQLIVKINGNAVLDRVIDKETTTDAWKALDIDLTEFAGKSVEIELVNQANGWEYEAGLWKVIRISTK